MAAQGRGAGVENPKVMEGKAQCWESWKQIAFYFLTFELLTL